MQQLIILAPAKINLSLDVVGLRADGYHLLSTVMQTIDLADQVELVLGPDENPTAAHKAVTISLTCDLGDIPLDRGNTAYKAASLFFSHEKIRPHISSALRVAIHIKKIIPVAAGLAGGSADAAAVLFGLNRCFPEHLAQQDLFELAVRTGADVPFCLQGGTVLCEGIGEQLTPLPSWSDLPVLLACPDQSLMTAQIFSAYNNLNGQAERDRPDTETVLRAVRNRDLFALAASTGNVLTAAACHYIPEIALLRQQMLDCGALVSQMSGSGPSVFSLFPKDLLCRKAIGRLESIWPYYRFICCRSRSAGPELIWSGTPS